MEEQIREVNRELGLRRKLYPQWVRSGKLDAGQAAHQLAALEAVLKTITLVDFAQRQLPLFPLGAEVG